MRSNKLSILVIAIQIICIQQFAFGQTLTKSEFDYKPKTKNAIELTTLNYQLLGIGYSRDLWESYSISTGIGFMPIIHFGDFRYPTRITENITTVPVTLRRYFLSDKHRPFLSGSVYNLFRETTVVGIGAPRDRDYHDPKTIYDIGVAAGGGYEFRANNGFEFRAGLELGYASYAFLSSSEKRPAGIIVVPGLQLGWRF